MFNVVKLVLLVHTVGTHKHTHYIYKLTHTSYAHVGRQRGKRGRKEEVMMAAVVVVVVGKGKWKSRGCAQVSQDQNMSAMLVSEL